MNIDEAYVQQQYEGNRLGPEHGAGYMEIELRFIREFLRFVKQDARGAASVLDVGCRTGYGLCELLRNLPVARVAGLDIVPEFVEEARAYAPEAEVTVGDICALPYPDRAFDWVYCSQTLEHALDCDAAVRELSRVAARCLYISVPLEQDNPELRTTNPSHHTFLADPLDWLMKWHGTPWRLTYAAFWAQFNYFNFVLVRTEVA